MDEDGSECANAGPVDALALVVYGRTGANHAAHLCQAMHLAFLRLEMRDGTLLLKCLSESSQGLHSPYRELRPIRCAQCPGTRIAGSLSVDKTSLPRWHV